MKVVIAEKPSVDREIARHLGAEEKREGYLTGNGYFVTWAYGHLVALGMPEDYGCSGFQKSSLPILPNPFILTVRKVKKDKVYSTDALASWQLKLIKYLLDRSESIIVATDAGREGELIFRYIYEYLKCMLPFERLWISSLTEKAIKRGFENLTTLSAEYRLPLADPDWALGRLLYIKRFKVNLFADYANGSTILNWTEFKDGKQLNYRYNDTKNYTSFGIDLTAQFHFLRFSQQFEAGIRALYLTDRGQFLIQPLILDIGF